jgi:hypothetical protein
MILGDVVYNHDMLDDDFRFEKNDTRSHDLLVSFSEISSRYDDIFRKHEVSYVTGEYMNSRLTCLDSSNWSCW